MKTSFVSFFLIVAVSFLLVSCGGKNRSGSGETNDSATTENECVKETSLSLFVDKKDLKDNRAFVTADSMFRINKQQFVFTNDSSAEIQWTGISKMSSGAEGEVVVHVGLYSKNGKTLRPGLYKNMDFDSDYFAKVNLETDAGTIWFNWATGLPDPGAVKIHQIDRSSVCGSVHLNVDKPDNNSIGVVKLNGNFYIEN